MPQPSKRQVLRCATLFLLVVGAYAHATNGYFSHGLGAKSKAMAGAGSAAPQDAMAVAANPAAAVMLGSRVDAGLSLFSPRRSFRAGTSRLNGHSGALTVGPGKVESHNRYFAIPHLGRVWRLGPDAATAVTLYGRGGMNTEYGGGTALVDVDGPGPAAPSVQPGPFGAGTAGVDLSQGFLDLTYARRSGALHWGLSLVLAAQVFEARGLTGLGALTETRVRGGAGQQPTHLSDNGHDWSLGYGLHTGVIWEVNERLNLAAAWHSRMAMQRFDRYADLFAGSGGFDVPASGMLGVSWAAAHWLTLHLDVEHIAFSDVDAVGNPLARIFACPAGPSSGTDVGACLGGGNGAGFGWDDVTVYKVGAEWRTRATPRWTWRAGFSQAHQPVEAQEALFNILAPAVVERHFSLGATRSSRAGREFTVAMTYAPPKTLHGTNAFDPTQTLRLHMRQFEVVFGMRF